MDSVRIDNKITARAETQIFEKSRDLGCQPSRSSVSDGKGLLGGL
jgi:hypothetical protein